MKKVLVGLAVIAIGVVLLVVKINYEQGKSSRQQEQIDNQNMCQIVGCSK
ncbi:hypothetical protein [Kribbella sp. NPDC049227]